MKKRSVMIGAAVATVLAFAAVLWCVSVKTLGVSDGRFLIAENGSCLVVLDDRSPVVLSDVRGRLFAGLSNGDRILVLHDGIQESYPGRTGAYATLKLSDGEISDIPEEVLNELSELGWWIDRDAQPDAFLDEVPDYRVSYANWNDSDQIYSKALNYDKMAISSTRHFPVYRFNTLQELEWFKAYFGGSLSMEYGYDEVPSFNDATAGYDNAFFKENSLVLVYVSASSGTYRYGVNRVHCDGEVFCVYVEQLNHPKFVTDDMAGWFITVAVADVLASGCEEFDAELVWG